MERVALALVADRIFVGLADSRLRGEGQGVPLINIKDLRDGLVPAAAKLDPRPVPSGANVERYRVQEQDVLITSRGTQLRIAIVPRDAAGALLSANLIAVRCGSRLLPHVLMAFLRTETGRHALLASGGSGLGLALKPKDLERLQVPIPPMALQRQLSELLQASEDHYRVGIDSALKRRALAQHAAASVLH